MEKSPICSEGFIFIKSAALFTTAVLNAIALLGLVPVMIFVVPAFEKMHADIGGLESFTPTHLVFSMSSYWYLAVPVVAVIPFLHIFTMRYFCVRLRDKHGWFLWLYGILGWFFWTSNIWGFIVISLYLPLVNAIKNIQ